MPRFSDASHKRLQTCHPDLIRLFEYVVQYFDCSVIEGARDEETQREYVRTGRSKTMNSKHITAPSLAVDVAPYPIDWANRDRFYYFAGFVKGVADNMGIKIRWGGDWDSDTQTKDQSFFDLPHFELVDAE